MSAVESRTIAEFDVEGLFPSLGLKVELRDDVIVGDGNVGSGVHDTWFVNDCGHVWCDGGSEFGWIDDVQAVDQGF